MRIAIAHHSLNFAGGAEKLCLSTIEALRDRGHFVSLVTVEKTDWPFVHRNFGKVTYPDREHYATKFRFSKNLSNIPVAATYFVVYILELLNNELKEKNDLIINTFGDVINSLSDVTYVHFPLRAAMKLSQIPAFANKSSWYAATPFYDCMSLALNKVHKGILLTNSKFTQSIIKEYLRRESLVVYPPVNVEDISLQSRKAQKLQNLVVVVASLTPKRHLEQVPAIARQSSQARFVIMGKADKYSWSTLDSLKRQIRSLRVQDKIKIQTNVPYESFKQTLFKARVYLHVMPFDHFGISVVEAMAAGSIPIVHRSGGPWMDILDEKQGEYGFSYASPQEAAEQIDALISKENLTVQVANRALNRAKVFDKRVFMKRIADVVQALD
jgi:glycosyltransferase involved in cell wall biosynthesis